MFISICRESREVASLDPAASDCRSQHLLHGPKKLRISVKPTNRSRAPRQNVRERHILPQLIGIDRRVIVDLCMDFRLGGDARHVLGRWWTVYILDPVIHWIDRLFVLCPINRQRLCRLANTGKRSSAFKNR